MKTSGLFSVLGIIALACVVGLLPSAANGEKFGGFGIVVSRLYDSDAPGNMGPIVVLHVPQDVEAYKAGIQAGDVILEIDGRQTAGREFGDIVFNSLRGEVGSSSELRIKRAPGDKTMMVTIKRTLITHTPGQEK